MDPRLHADITARLENDFKFKKKVGSWLQQGVCPKCEHKSVWTHADEPWLLRCDRLNKCGAEFHVKELYPDLFDKWSERYPASEANPQAAADAYLQDGRGFDLSLIKGWYSQESYWDRDLKIGSATVRFPVANGFWERLIDQPQRFGKKKARFKPGTSYAHTWWCPPGLDLVGANEIWIVEGIFDEIALLHHDLIAVSAMSSNNDCAASLAALAKACADAGKPRPKLVWALDGDKAGRDNCKRWALESRKAGWEVSAAQIPQDGKSKLDWNDMHQRGHLDEKHVKEYRYQGSLLLAGTPAEKATLMYGHDGSTSFPFEHDQRLYWWKLDIEKLHKVQEGIEEADPDLTSEKAREQALMQSNTVTEICNCLPTPLYYLKNDVTDEAWYYFRIDFPHDGPSVKNTFTAGQISAAAEFKKRLLHSGAGAIWTGSAGQLDRLLAKWTFAIKKVETIDYIGYSLQHKAYVFNDLAAHGERIVSINDEDYFDLGKLAIKSLSKSLKLDLNPDMKDCRTDWFDKFYLCFGPRGVIALAYWLGSLFAEQIRDRFESFPFIEIVGEAGAGKTTLLETLWKLLGRNGYEGFDPMKGSTVGFLRSMAQVSNLPVVLIESDREDDGEGGKGRPKSAFHWDSLKSLYNGGSLRTTGVKSAGNDTYEPQFRGTLVISQNATVQASTPIMERIVHLTFDKSRQSDAGREAALELGRMPAREVSGFMLKAITRETAVLGLIEKNQRGYELSVKDAGVKNQRIHKNYAQLMVFVDALSMVCPVTGSQQEEAKRLLIDLAIEREQALAHDHPMVEAFWEAFDYLNGADDAGQLNHHRDPNLIAVNLNHFVQIAAERKQQIPPISELKRLLKTSRDRKFIDIRPVNSRINEVWNRRVENPDAKRADTVKCWVFQKEVR